jgi:hypothetical protein
VDRSSNLVRRQCYELQSSLKQAGFSRVAAITDEFLEYAKATKKNNRPGGFALRRSGGEGNSRVHWCLWAHGGYTVDLNGKVIINSPEIEKALNYAKQLYENMIPGVVSWNYASNNKASGSSGLAKQNTKQNTTNSVSSRRMEYLSRAADRAAAALNITSLFMRPRTFSAGSAT